MARTGEGEVVLGRWAQRAQRGAVMWRLANGVGVPRGMGPEPKEPRSLRRLASAGVAEVTTRAAEPATVTLASVLEKASRRSEPLPSSAKAASWASRWGRVVRENWPLCGLAVWIVACTVFALVV